MTIVFSLFVLILCYYYVNNLEIAVVLVLGLLVRWIPFLQTTNGLCLAGFCCSAVIFGINAFWLYLNAAVVLLSLMAIGQVQICWIKEKLYYLFMLMLIAGFVIFSLKAESKPSFIVILDMILFLKYLILIWEYASGQVEVAPWNVFLAWVGLPFVNIYVRLSDFKCQTKAGRIVPKPINRELLIDSCIRFGMIGMARLLSVVDEFIPRSGITVHLLNLYGLSPWGWYLQAAGFAGLMRNGGALAGIAVPENFRSPFLATNISDFWSRWNIGATHAFRDMLFFNRFGFSFYNPYLNTMIVFLAMGAWHAINPYWLLFGLIHGIGFCCYIAFGSRLDWSANWKLRLLGWACTYCFVCSCWALPPQLMKLGRALSATLGVS